MPFKSESSAKDFAEKTGGSITTQRLWDDRIVHQVHYSPSGSPSKSQDVNEESDFDSDINGNGTNWHTSEDL